MPSPTITTADAKQHCRVYHTDDDAYIDGLVVAAVEEWEQVTRTKVTQASVSMICYERPADGVLRPDWGPANPSLTGQTVSYTNDAGEPESQTLLATDWEVRGGFATIPCKDDWRYPLTLSHKPGWSALVTPPNWLKQALLFRVAEMYHYRGDDVQSPGSKAFIAIARRHGLGQLA